MVCLGSAPSAIPEQTLFLNLHQTSLRKEDVLLCCHSALKAGQRSVVKAVSVDLIAPFHSLMDCGRLLVEAVRVRPLCTAPAFLRRGRQNSGGLHDNVGSCLGAPPPDPPSTALSWGQILDSFTSSENACVLDECGIVSSSG